MTSRSKRRRGMAILVVMVIVVLLALAAYGFNQQMIEAYRRSTWDIEQVQAENAARSGIEFGLAWVDQARSNRLAASANGTSSFVFDLGGEEATEEDTGVNWSFAILSPAATAREGRNGARDSESEKRYAWRSGLVNESAKLNVNQLKKWDATNPGSAKRALMRLPGADEATVDRWLELQGIRSGGSQARGRRSLLERMEEKVAESSGLNVDPQRLWAQLWMGGDWDWNYSIDPMEEAINERLSKNSTEVLRASDLVDGQQFNGLPWRDYLTFHSGQRNVNLLGQARIFLNTSDLRTLHRELRETWAEDVADFVIAARQFGFIKGIVGAGDSLNQSSQTLRSDASLTWEPDFSRPATVMLQSPLDLVGASVSITTSDGKRLTLRSPLQGDVQSMGNYLGGLVDDVTVDPNEVVIGQIDILEAPAEVLAAIPGIQSAEVEKILEARLGGTDRTAERETVAWLITENVLTWDRFAGVYPWITVGGDCYSGQVVGFRDDMSPVIRYTMVFDGRTEEIRVRDLQSWHGWGKGFSVEQLRSLRKL